MQKTKTLQLAEVGTTPAKHDLFDHFFFMGKAEIEIASTCLYTKPKTKQEKAFFKLLKKALKLIKSGYWIATIEPGVKVNYHTFSDNSFTGEHQIYFKNGCDTEYPLYNFEWEEKAKEFAPAWDSDIAYWYEWVIFLAYRVAKNYCSMYFICNNSSDSTKPGMYYSEPAPSGSYKIAGFYDGICNTRKITKNHSDSRYVIFGIPYYQTSVHGERIADNTFTDPNDHNRYSAGVIVLRKTEVLLPNTIPGKKLAPSKDDKVLKAKNTIDTLKQLSDFTDFGDSDKNIKLIVSKLYEILEILELDATRYIKFANLFEVYVPEFYRQLNLFAELKKANALTEKEKNLITVNVKKFYQFLEGKDFSSTIDIDNAKIEFNAIAKTFSNLLDRD